MKLLIQLRAYWRLGAHSIFDVLVYRIGLRTKLHPVLKITSIPLPGGAFFSPATQLKANLAATPVWQNQPWAFGYPVGAQSIDPPDWHANILTGVRIPNPDQPWHKIATFSEYIGDIKAVWEASRFDWVLAFAQNAARGDNAAVVKLNTWLTDWVLKNPCYSGPNWICGQETSFRVAHLAIAAAIMGQLETPSSTLLAFILNHLRRIHPTIAYARGQDNNHATSEAMALIIGGLWLVKCSSDLAIRAEATKYVAAGRALMEERVRKLIFADGGFAQYSIVYHRLMLDSLAITEYFCRLWDAEQFSDGFYHRAKSATNWLAYFIDPETGDAPNLGSNDGAWLLPIGSSKYRDFRPSCALASTLFDSESYFGHVGVANELLLWLDIKAKPLRQVTYQAADIFADSGIIALNRDKTRIFIRLPGYVFRPHQSDALHIDVWHDGQCLMQDAGTFSYAAHDWQYFPSTAAHNSIEFDCCDQMPRLGRFLYGEWLARGVAKAEGNSAVVSYTNYRRTTHARTITLHDEFNIEIIDAIGGNFNSAILRWRPTNSLAKTVANQFANSNLSLIIKADTDIIRQETVDHKSSSHYLYFNKICAIETEVTRPSRLTTAITILPGAHQ